jgi:predicted O-methyltransferase YrrM
MTCARLTARRGGLARRVALRPGHNLDGLRAGDRFDLVIGNPPELDPGRALRAGFWSRVGRHLRPGGLVVVCEVQPGPGALAAAARASGLEAVGSFPIALTTRGKRLEALVARRPS